ncbi:MAG: hypothetical protein WDZ77_01105 [Candidatus Pacearchaeota archaeon]
MTKEEVKEKKKEEKKITKKPSQAEYEKKVLDLAKEGLTSEKIGEKLRRERIHPKEFSKKVSQILKEKEVYINPDLKNAEEKLEKLKQHYEKNKQDKRAMRERDRIAAKLRKTKKYFKVQ